MCIFKKAKLEIYTENPHMPGDYHQTGEEEAAYKKRMSSQRRTIKQENIARNAAFKNSGKSAVPVANHIDQVAEFENDYICTTQEGK